jgi:hypothetical protein
LGDNVVEGARKSGHIASRTRQARHKSAADGIGRVTHDDRDGTRRLLRRPDRSPGPQHENLDLQAHQLGGELGEALVASFRQAPLDGKIRSLSIAKLAHALQQAIVDGLQRGRPATQKSDPPQPLDLLRAHRERPRRRAAQKRDEVAPLHCLMLPVLSTERIAHLVRHEAAALQDFDPAHDSYRSI